MVSTRSKIRRQAGTRSTASSVAPSTHEVSQPSKRKIAAGERAATSPVVEQAAAKLSTKNTGTPVKKMARNKRREAQSRSIKKDSSQNNKEFADSPAAKTDRPARSRGTAAACRRRSPRLMPRKDYSNSGTRVQQRVAIAEATSTRCESQVHTDCNSPVRTTTRRQIAARRKPKKSTTGAGAGAGATRAHEVALKKNHGRVCVVGVDEAGRGPLAGPVVAAACHVPLHVTIEGVGDSKVLTEAEREKVYAALEAHPEIHFAVTIASNKRIDDINILQASLESMAKSVAKLQARGIPVDHALVDGNRMPKWMPCPTDTIIKGDAKSVVIAAASIVAKVTRDRLMIAFDKQYPAYGFAQHKGYPVPDHMRAVYSAGPCPIHRITFAPIKQRGDVQKRLNEIYAARAKRKEDQTGEWWQLADADEAAWMVADL